MMEKFRITSDNVNKFVAPPWQRLKRTSGIYKFVKLIEEGNFFDMSTLTVNKVNGTYRIINGSHRIEAIKIYLKRQEGRFVDVHLDLHEGLTTMEEKEIFDKISTETPQSIDDYIFIHKDEIKLYEWVKKSFPVSVGVYQYVNGIRFRQLIIALESSEKTDRVFVTSSRREHLLSFAKMVKEEEYRELYKFFEIYKKTIGGVKGNNMYKPNVLTPLLNIYLINTRRDVMMNKITRWSDEHWADLFRKMSIDHIILSYAQNVTSREKLYDVRERILHLANRLRGRGGLI